MKLVTPIPSGWRCNVYNVMLLLYIFVRCDDVFNGLECHSFIFIYVLNVCTYMGYIV